MEHAQEAQTPDQSFAAVFGGFDDPYVGSFKAGYEVAPQFHAGCVRRKGTSYDAYRTIVLEFDDQAFIAHRSLLEIAIMSIEKHARQRFGVSLDKYWDAHRAVTVLRFFG